MKTILILFTLILFAVSPLYSQEPNEKYIVAKGCKKIQDNLELKNCLVKQLSTIFSRGTTKKLINELNPGINKFFIEFRIQSDKSIDLVNLNSTNRIIKKDHSGNWRAQ